MLILLIEANASDPNDDKRLGRIGTSRSYESTVSLTLYRSPVGVPGALFLPNKVVLVVCFSPIITFLSRMFLLLGESIVDGINDAINDDDGLFLLLSVVRIIVTLVDVYCLIWVGWHFQM